ncbi:MAG: hypothetical protein J7647_30205 [Cyanobacteria bacterium SBLK]|nr:hypothetical protein [Cyanobacteria bacterium SBLK]
MSLIHWNKSVVTFHLKEMMEDRQPTDALTVAGLGAIAIAPLAVPLLAKLSRPLAKAAIKSGLSLYYEGKTILESEDVPTETIASPAPEEEQERH